jgi:hypothetical protein
MGSSPVEPKIRKDDYPYDVCLSFAGEDRAYVAKVAQRLKALGIRVFYDAFEEGHFGERICTST